VDAVRGRTIACVAVATAATAALVASGAGARSADTDATGRERPRGPVLACPRISGIGGLREFKSRWNLVVGPLAMKGAAARPAFYSPDFGGNKFPVLVMGGHRVTIEVARDARPGAGLVYGPRPKRPQLARDGYRVVTFIACRRGQIQDDIVDGWPVTGWSGGVLARSARCVPLFVWVDDAPRPRRAVIYLGVRECG
jgi:hypothetical protein